MAVGLVQYLGVLRGVDLVQYLGLQRDVPTII
jgi:hypothetical protein